MYLLSHFRLLINDRQLEYRKIQSSQILYIFLDVIVELSLLLAPVGLRSSFELGNQFLYFLGSSFFKDSRCLSELHKGL